MIAFDTQTEAFAGAFTALAILDRLDNLPAAYSALLVGDDSSAPLIRAGEVVIWDQGGPQLGGWYPTEGGLFVIEHRAEPNGLGRYPRVDRKVVQTHKGRDGWYASNLRRGVVGQRLYCSDGPYPSEQTLADKLIGRVVGIYAPTMGGRA